MKLGLPPIFFGGGGGEELINHMSSNLSIINEINIHVHDVKKQF